MYLALEGVERIRDVPSVALVEGVDHIFTLRSVDEEAPHRFSGRRKNKLTTTRRAPLKPYPHKQRLRYWSFITELTNTPYNNVFVHYLVVSVSFLVVVRLSQMVDKTDYWHLPVAYRPDDGLCVPATDRWRFTQWCGAPASWWRTCWPSGRVRGCRPHVLTIRVVMQREHEVSSPTISTLIWCRWRRKHSRQFLNSKCGRRPG